METCRLKTLADLGALRAGSALAAAWLCPPAGKLSGAESCQQLLEERAVGLPGHPCRPHLQPLEDGGLVQLRAQWLALQKQEKSTPALQAAAAYADALERKLSGGS